MSWLGDSDSARSLDVALDRVVDLKGRSVLPAFCDSHTHFHRTAILQEHFLDFANPRPRTIAEVLDAVERRAQVTKAGSWIEGDNLMDADVAERRWPTREELDRVAPANPVLIRGMGKHVVIGNSRALAEAGIDELTEDPPGGRIERGAGGQPTGVLHERGKLRLDTTRGDTVVPPLSVEDRLDALESGLRRLWQFGLAGIHEIVRSPEEFADYLRLRERGSLPLRVTSYVRVVEGRASLDDLANIGMRTGYGDAWLRLGGVKVSIDGSCTFRNAALYDPYPGEEDNRGIIRIEIDELREVIRRSDSLGLQVAVHAIGPRAVDMSLDAFETAVDPANVGRMRHRIEHAYLPPRPGQLERMAGLKLTLSTQPAFINSVGDVWIEIFGADAVEEMVPLRSALDAGVKVQANSDCPTGSLDPRIGIATAIRRTTRSGRRLGTRQAVSLAEAVEMYTKAPAFSAFEEGSRGSLEPGKVADVVVFGGDLTATGDVADVPIDATIMDGEIVYERARLLS